jgi:hypothetical protein
MSIPLHCHLSDYLRGLLHAISRWRGTAQQNIGKLLLLPLPAAPRSCAGTPTPIAAVLGPCASSSLPVDRVHWTSPNCLGIENDGILTAMMASTAGRDRDRGTPTRWSGRGALPSLASAGVRLLLLLAKWDYGQLRRLRGERAWWRPRLAAPLYGYTTTPTGAPHNFIDARHGLHPSAD